MRGILWWCLRVSVCVRACLCVCVRARVCLCACVMMTVMNNFFFFFYWDTSLDMIRDVVYIVWSPKCAECVLCFHVCIVDACLPVACRMAALCFHQFVQLLACLLFGWSFLEGWGVQVHDHEHRGHFPYTEAKKEKVPTVLHSTSCCSVPQLNTPRVTQYVHPHLYLYKYMAG